MLFQIGNRRLAGGPPPSFFAQSVLGYVITRDSRPSNRVRCENLSMESSREVAEIVPKVACGY